MYSLESNVNITVLIIIYLLKMHMNAYSGTTAVILHGHDVEHNGLHIYILLYWALLKRIIGRNWAQWVGLKLVFQITWIIYFTYYPLYNYACWHYSNYFQQAISMCMQYAYAQNNWWVLNNIVATLILVVLFMIMINFYL